MNWLCKIAKLADERVNQYGAQYFTFAFFVIINYPIGYLYGLYSEHEVNYAYLALRLLSFILCLPLLFNHKCPKNLAKYLAIYWFVTVTLAIPIMGVYMLLEKNFSLGWVINFNIGVMMMVLIVDWLMFLLLEIIGITIGACLFIALHDKLPSVPSNEVVTLFFYMYFWISITGVIFSRNKEVFNQILLKVKEKLNMDLQSQVAERTHELSDALAIKTEFLNNISHEIRTPAMGVGGIANELVAQWDSLGESKRYFYLQQIAKNSNRLTSMLGSVLDLAKSTDGQIFLDITNIDLNKIIEEMIDESQTLYLEGKKIKFTFHPKGLPKMQGDLERISQVIRNLFVNAIKFSPSNSTITIKADLEGEYKIKFSISDSGVGIPTDELSAIFLPFTQSSRTKTKAGGTGLGLAISSKIIEAHHGKIWAESNKKGATFCFEIPLTPTQTSAKSREAAFVKNKQHSILIIDDEETCLTTLELLLSNENYKITKAEGAIEGLRELASGKHFDLILLDMMMPDIYGLEFLKTIIKDENHRQIPVIIQSGIADQSEFDKAIKLGAEGYIKKPYQKNILLDSISRVLSSC